MTTACTKAEHLFVTTTPTFF